MKKTHLILLVITAVMALFSAYSLAAINQVYKINFEWYSQYNKNYTDEQRETSRDKWSLPDYPAYMHFSIVGSEEDFDKPGEEHIVAEQDIPELDFSRYIYFFCSLGPLTSPEYRVKIDDIAQRANVVEVKVSLNSPAKLAQSSTNPDYVYQPVDVIRINKLAFPTKGRLYFVFKSQDGRQLYEKYFDVE